MSSTKGSSSKKETPLKTKTKHGSTVRPSSKGGNSKHLDDINKEVSQLTEKARILEGENEELKEKLRTLSVHLIDAGRQNGDDVDFDPNSDVLDIPVIELMTVIAGFSSKPGQKVVTLSKSKDLEENRLEDLETRVTQLNGELAKLLKLKLKVESGLQEVSRCRDREEAVKKAMYLWYESSGTQLFVDLKVVDDSPVTSPVTSPVLSPMAAPLNTSMTTQVTAIPAPANHSKTRNGLPPSIQLNLERVHIVTPTDKLPADTHITNMNKALQQIIIQELSLYKGNGADWRMFAERVGVPAQLVTQWKTMRLPQPMKNVLYIWGESPGASVRMLHRHLVSPQMKCVLLAKRLSDFYEVD